mmetsp:Transcript_32603/g.87534  ORF Transcript_32603/g.87534 Transcript_32603/m.87534 type:complete len:303 (-) Transcript_32603:63-971(-)
MVILLRSCIPRASCNKCVRHEHWNGTSAQRRSRAMITSASDDSDRLTHCASWICFPTRLALPSRSLPAKSTMLTLPSRTARPDSGQRKVSKNVSTRCDRGGNSALVCVAWAARPMERMSSTSSAKLTPLLPNSLVEKPKELSDSSKRFRTCSFLTSRSCVATVRCAPPCREISTWRSISSAMDNERPVTVRVFPLLDEPYAKMQIAAPSKASFSSSRTTVASGGVESSRITSKLYSRAERGSSRPPVDRRRKCALESATSKRPAWTRRHEPSSELGATRAKILRVPFKCFIPCCTRLVSSSA